LIESTNFYLQTLEKQRYYEEEEIQEGNFTHKGLCVLNLDLNQRNEILCLGNIMSYYITFETQNEGHRLWVLFQPEEQAVYVSI